MDDLISRSAPRLIDADALVYRIEKRMDSISDESFAEGLSEAIIEINLSPTIDPESLRVVRCEDCVLRNTATSKAYGGYWCEETTSFVKPDDFCSRGKRTEVSE